MNFAMAALQGTFVYVRRLGKNLDSSQFSFAQKVQNILTLLPDSANHIVLLF